MYDNVFDNKGLNEITLKLKEDIKKNTAQNSPIYDLWFSEMSVLRMTDMIIFISVNTDMQKLTIEYKYMHLITDAVKKIYGLDLKVGIYYTQDGKITKEQMDADEKRILLDDIDEDSIGNNKDKKNTGAAAVKKDFSTGPKQNIDNLGLLGLDIEPGEESEILMKHKYTFSNFVVGSSNRFAYKACTMVAQYPAVKYNPFFIHGPSGLGKTHLLCAISNEYARRFKHAKVIYVNGEDFANELIDHITEKNPKKAQQFRDKYRGCDMLLIDDIHFIAGKPSTQEEIFHTFNALYEAGKQIILTSDRPPKDINLLEERIKSRFESGLIVDIQPPDLELRIAILKRKSEDAGIKITHEVLFFLAENISSNIRQIEGAIKKLNAYSYLNNSEIPKQYWCLNLNYLTGYYYTIKLSRKYYYLSLNYLFDYTNIPNVLTLDYYLNLRHLIDYQYNLKILTKHSYLSLN